jgi:phosphoglycolate phosphatase
MPNKFDLIVFDWDGTLLDSTGVIVLSLQRAADDVGLTCPLDEDARHVIGLGLSNALEYLFPSASSQQVGLLVDRYFHHYAVNGQRTTLFEGVTEVIENLHTKGLLLAVATGKGRSELDNAFESSGLGQYLHASRCADETFSKPHPAMLLELMAQFDVEPRRALMIGDTTHDLQMAVNAKVAGLGVTYGAHPRESLFSLAPIDCVNSIMELNSWLKTNV